MTPDAPLGFPLFWGVLRGVACRPRLWLTALRQCVRAIPRGWWRRPPFLPLPDRTYLRYRLETAYGFSGVPTPAELLRYLEWCRTTDTARRAGRG